jgi:hypothetical protein
LYTWSGEMIVVTAVAEIITITAAIAKSPRRQRVVAQPRARRSSSASLCVRFACPASDSSSRSTGTASSASAEHQTTQLMQLRGCTNSASSC